MMDEDEVNGICEMCGGGRFVGGNDGYYYCTDCHHQSQDVMDTGVADEDFANTGADGFYLNSHRRREHASAPGLRAIKAEPISQFVADSYVPGFFGGSGVKKEEVVSEEFNGPIDFGWYEADDQKRYKNTYSEVRMRYVMGIQLMLEMQCTALVENFGVNPLICGLASSIWLRFVAASEVFDDGWADNAISESEAKQPGIQEDIDRPPRYFREFRNSHGERAVMIWYKSLRKMIPLSSSLAVSYLACHVARESILPTHILKWTLEGKLPYLAAFTEIQRRHPSRCPLSASFMFKPSEVVPTQKLEAMAAKVADIIGLDLPPVNFHDIAFKYLKQLSLPVENILQRADCIVDWSMPPELWLSVNELRLPTRVYVMAVLIVSIRILYNIHGFGVWEKSLSTHERKFDSNVSLQLGSSCEHNNVSPSCSVAESPTKSKGQSMLNNDSCLDAGELLRNLEAKYGKLLNSYEYSQDLPTYLNYNKNVIFAGTELLNHNEKTIAEELWDIYLREPEQNEEYGTPYDNMRKGKRSRDYETPHDGNSSGSDSKRIAYSGDAPTPSAHGKSFRLDDHSEKSYIDDHAIPRTPNDPSSPAIDHQAASKSKEEAINRLKADMEENRFCYIPPRVNVKRHDYLHYVRKKDGGAYTYVAHADYYILLRACARITQVDIRLMHVGVMNFERRLAWIEKRIDHCLKFRRPDVENGDCNEIDSQHECSDEVSLV